MLTGLQIELPTIELPEFNFGQVDTKRLTHPASHSMEDFTRFTMPEYQVNWHHSLICQKLDEFVNGRIKRLMIFAPPRHGKSELVSRRLPAYILGKNPDAGIISASYGSDLARRMNRDVQRIIDHPHYKQVFPHTQLYGKNIRATAQGSYLRNSDIFEVVGYKGFYRSAGVGGAITGMGMNYGIIDDPYKNRQDANSETIRNTVWDWYVSTFRTRLAPDGSVVIILTRWHEQDLAAALLELAHDVPEADQWEVVVLPAIATADRRPYDNRHEGQALWPERFDTKALETTRLTLGSYEWSALYQQNPTPPEGNFFKRSWFDIVHALPDGCQFVRWWDRAATAGAGDYTVGVLIARKGNTYVVADVVRGQWSSGERDKIILQTAALDKQQYGHVEQWTEQEPGSSGKDAALAFVGMLAGYSARFETSTGSKEQRADPFRSQAEVGNVKLLDGIWNRAYLDELTAFPHGAHDDQVDGSSGSFNKLALGVGIIETASNPFYG